MALEVESMLFEGQSPFQKITAFKSKTWGNVLTLDGLIQATERDEFSYQEMITHIPMFAHGSARKVFRQSTDLI